MMNLEQFNVDVEPDFKKTVRLDSVEFEMNHGVIANTIFSEFFRRHPDKEKRQKLYRKMQAKLNRPANGNNGNGAHTEQTTR